MDNMWLVNDVRAVKCFLRDKSERKVALRGRGERAVELETGGNIAQKNKNRYYRYRCQKPDGLEPLTMK